MLGGEESPCAAAERGHVSQAKARSHLQMLLVSPNRGEAFYVCANGADREVHVRFTKTHSSAAVSFQTAANTDETHLLPKPEISEGGHQIHAGLVLRQRGTENNCQLPLVRLAKMPKINPFVSLPSHRKCGLNYT